MARYVLNSNAQSNGDHEVHNKTAGCRYLPHISNQIDLGSHPNCQSAVAEAKRRYPRARINGCYWCARPCHTG